MYIIVCLPFFSVAVTAESLKQKQNQNFRNQNEIYERKTKCARLDHNGRKIQLWA